MDVFLMIRRQKTTVFTDAKESTTVYEVKKIVEGILKVPPENQQLFKGETGEEVMEDNKTLGDYNFNSNNARAQAPATIGLSFRQEDNQFEPLQITALSTPPDLPDVMKPPDNASAHPQEQAA